MDMTGPGSQIRDRLLDDLWLLIRDAEDLLRNTRQQMDDGYQAARARFESTLSSTKSGLATLEQRVTASGRDAVDSANQYVQERPWQAVGAGALAGLVLGLWLGRR